MEQTHAEITPPQEPLQPRKEMSVVDWAITLFVASLPLIGLIMLFVWAFGSDANLTRRNFSKAALLLILISIIIYVILILIFASFFKSFWELSNQYV